MTPNRFDGRDSTRWWADLPPRIRARFTPVHELTEPESPASKSTTADSRFLALASRLGVPFLLILLTNLLVIVILLLTVGMNAGLPTGETVSNP